MDGGSAFDAGLADQADVARGGTDSNPAPAGSKHPSVLGHRPAGQLALVEWHIHPHPLTSSTASTRPKRAIATPAPTPGDARPSCAVRRSRASGIAC
jgi:hypothetical protein